VLAQYSIINSDPLEFSARASTNSLLLSLSQDDLISASEENESIFQALERAQDYLNEWGGAPACDYNQIYIDTEDEG
jgi:hypothetical protein